jgi:predicted alpha/beta-fold hydrolase
MKAVRASQVSNPFESAAFLLDGATVSDLSAGFIVPTGAAQKPIDPECYFPTIEGDLLAKGASNAEVFRSFKEYFKRCESRIHEGLPAGVAALAQSSMIKYDIFSHPQIQQVTLTLSDGRTLFGILALKADSRPRPFLVVRCGVLCEAGSSASIRNYMMTLFDESPFNLLILASNTAGVEVIANRSMLFGGPDEAEQMLEIGNWLKTESSLKERISSLHMLGISLGGNTAAFTSLYNDNYEKANARRVFESVTGVCPAIELENSMRALLRDDVVGNVAAGQIWDTIKAARSSLPLVRDLLDISRPKPEALPDLMAMGAARYSVQRLKSFGRSPYSPGDIVDMPSFWNQTSFLAQAKQLTTPTFFLAAKDDIIVHTDVNAALVENSGLARRTPDLGVLQVAYGSHCAFAMSYADPIVTSILRTFILANSPEFIEKRKTANARVNFKIPKLLNWETHVAQEWSIASGDSAFTLRLRIFNPSRGNDSKCFYMDPYSGDFDCMREERVKVPLANLPVRGLRVPANDAEAQSLTRQVNSSLRVMGADGALTGTHQAPARIEWFDE